jgi:UDP-N-acetylmuramoylalanine--D-glutamate ligase
VGNIGVPPISCVDERQQGEWLVAELSSFQLQNCHRLHPQAACLLNVTPDHLSWHGSMQAYAQAKGRIFRNLGTADLAVLSDGDDACDEMRARLAARGVDVCVVSCDGDPGTPSAGYLEDGALTVRLRGVELLRMSREGLQLAGDHNVQNALAAAALVLHAGADPSAVMTGLASFAPLEHRAEPCGTVGGVRFVNDSKATNTDATEKALASFAPGSVIVLLGGHDKGTDLSSLAQVVGAHASLAVCYGEAGPRIAMTLAELAPTLAVAEAPHMAEALEVACDIAQDGQTVLLSPACSSFDEFRSFEERGEVFKHLVAARLAQAEVSR